MINRIRNNDDENDAGRVEVSNRRGKWRWNVANTGNLWRKWVTGFKPQHINSPTFLLCARLGGIEMRASAKKFYDKNNQLQSFRDIIVTLEASQYNKEMVSLPVILLVSGRLLNSEDNQELASGWKEIACTEFGQSMQIFRFEGALMPLNDPPILKLKFDPQQTKN